MGAGWRIGNGHHVHAGETLWDRASAWGGSAASGLAAGQFPAEAPRRPEAEDVVAAIVTAVAYIGSLLAHELAHSLVARRNGVQVEGITLWLLGGVSRLQGEIPNPAAEVRVAGAGPLTSLVLGGVFTLVAW